MRGRIRRFGKRQDTISPLAFVGVRAGNCSALWLNPSGFTAFARPAGPLPGEVGLLCSFHELPTPGTSAVRPFPADKCLAGTMASADPCRLSLTFRLGLPLPWLDDRSPQVRTLTFPAPSPHLPHQPLIASGFVVSCQLARLVRPLMRFVSLKSQVCLRLPSDPTSR